MAFVPVPNILQVEMLYTWQGQQIENTLYFWSSGGWQPVEVPDLHEVIVAAYQAEVQPEVSPTLSLNSIKYTDISSQTGFSLERNAGLPIVGTANTGAMPNSVALCVKFGTDLRGRSFRGRNYCPGAVEGGVLGNEFVASFINAWLDFYRTMAADANSIGASHHVVSRYANGEQRPVGVATLVTSYSVTDPIVDSQRRRLPGRGR